MVGAISREFQRSPRQFFNARNFTCTCHIAAISEYNSVILLLGFTTSEMLHRCTTEAFLLQSFFNLILKGNNIVVCFCLMSNALANSIFKTLVDSIIASFLFKSLFYHLSHVLIEPGMHISIVNKV